MSNKVKTIIGVSVISILVILIIICTVIALNSTKEKEVIDTVADTYSEENIQKNIEETLEDEEKIDIEKLFLENEGKDVIGVIKIEKINFEGLVYENTTLETLSKGIGHFTNSPYINGNVCLAAHNTNKFWAKLNTLEVGDKITYISFLGTKEYQVQSIEEILETDWSKLENTEENIITLITCVKGKPELRLCVQGIEV